MKMPPLHKYSTEYKTCALTGLTGFSGRVCLAFRARKQLRISFWFYFSSTFIIARGVPGPRLLMLGFILTNILHTNILLRKRISTPITSQEKWLSDLQVENASDIDWKDANTIAFHCTASTKLGTFHYKFLHRRNDVKQVLIQKGLKSTALTDLHLMGL